MSRTLPPIPPPLESNTRNSSSPNPVDTIPTDNTNNTTTNNVAQNVVDENLPQLLDSIGDGPFVPMSSLSNSTNPLPKPQKQWSHADRHLANQDKRLKTHEGPSDTRDTKIAALRLKFNAFIALEGEKDIDSDVEEDLRSSSGFIADLNIEYHERALLANQMRFFKRSRRVESARKPVDK
ncbi:hypothetical protein Tco_1533051 [Tanacetum coccineum]